MDFQLTEEHQQIREMARTFTQNVLKPGVIDRDRDYPNYSPSCLRQTGRAEQ